MFDADYLVETCTVTRVGNLYVLYLYDWDTTYICIPTVEERVALISERNKYLDFSKSLVGRVLFLCVYYFTTRGFDYLLYV